MPFRSRRQMKFMFAKHPTIAKRWAAESKRKGRPQIVKSKRRKS